MSEEIEAILSKYSNQEVTINEKLTKKKEEKVQKQTEFRKDKREKRMENMEKAILRNKQVIQELETIKSYLRSKAIFSPSEMVFDDICEKYKEKPSLKVNKWKCHLAVFV